MDTTDEKKLELKQEFEAAQLGDLRRSKRLRKVAEAMQDAPAEGYPSMMGSEAALEAYYRLINNEAIEPQDILAPHYRSSAERAAECDKVLVVHDQTAFKCDYDDQKDQMGYLNTGKSGFYGQFSLLVDADALNEPLGMSCVSTLFREHESNYPSQADKPSGADYAHQDDSESRWWVDHARQSQALLADDLEVVHVMDSGADSYARFDKLDQAGLSFIVRKAHNRNARRPDNQAWHKLEEVVDAADVQAEREVSLSRRQPASAPQRQRLYPARQPRQARLELSSCAVEFKSPRYLDGRQTLELWAVRAREVEPPDDQEPVDWLLLTNQPVEGVDDILEIIDHYRARWRIEQFFKALKTGCAFRKRQLENRRAMLNALAITTPMAWLLMALRGAFHERPNQPAEPLLGPVRLKVLRHFAAREVPEDATIEKAILAVAGMGGHKRSNGPPGWMTLGRGLRQLRLLTHGWLAAKRESKM